jgi:hypothetical protein
MTTRQRVFAVIDGEREYQEGKWTPANSDYYHSEAEWLVFIEDYVHEAKQVYSRFPGDEARRFVLHTLRKIATLAVAAMEQHGAPTRQEEGPRPVGARGLSKGTQR